MIVILNNKSNLTKSEFIIYQNDLRNIKVPFELVLCPTYLNINLFDLSNISLGSQNVSCTNEGAYTGEISAKSLKDSNVRYCIIGHSERRKYQKETNEEINKKVKELISNDIIPILCVGETKEQREKNEVEQIIVTQVKEAIKEINDEDRKKIIVAYEPIWSIGTGLIPKVNDIEIVNSYIKKILPECKVIYGGSVNEENINELKSDKIDGYLLGGLSLKPQKLEKFLNKI